LFFGGSFEALAGGSDLAENEPAATDASASSGSGKTKRVSSVGARLPEPEPPVTEVATASAPTTEATPENKVAAPDVQPEVPTPKAKPTTATPRTRRPAGRRTPTTAPVKPKVSETTATEDTAKKEESKTAEATPETAAPSEVPKARPSSRTNPRRTATTTTAKTTKPKPEPATEVTPEPEIGPRLIIETSDGTLINRSMSTVRRVMVENGQVVVTAKDGKIDRIPLANVVRMSIAP
jgi:hypothetical protein